MTSILAGDRIIPVAQITGLDISGLVTEEVVIVTTTEGDFIATGFHAIEAVMAIKPSAMEGRRLRWRKGAWAVHNMIGHPVMQILAWFGFGAAAVRFHDWTTPRPLGFR